MTPQLKLDRLRLALALRGAGMTFKQMGVALGGLSKPGPITLERARQIFLKAKRFEARGRL